MSPDPGIPCDFLRDRTKSLYAQVGVLSVFRLSGVEPADFSRIFSDFYADLSSYIPRLRRAGFLNEFRIPKPSQKIIAI